MRQATEAQSRPPVKIALVGKYVQLEDAYLSVVEALRHSGFQHGRGIEIDWVDSETLDDGEVRARLHGADGILIPGGFGVRGIEGKITAARIAREQKIPFLGICLGMQMAVADFARHIVGMDGANSTEFDPETPYPVIDLLPEQKEVADMGGTMRLGADPIKLHPNTRAREIYGEAVIYERHRHRYEVNNFLRKRIEAAGLVCSGTSPDERLVEIIEIPDHPFFVASQYHPEFKSRPERPAPLFRDFVAAALERMKEQRPQELTTEEPATATGDARQRGGADPAPRAGARTRPPRPSPARPLRPASEAEKARQGELFADLCRIPSPSGEEAACAERVAAELRAMGLEVERDEAGNLLARVRGPLASGPCCSARTWTRCRRRAPIDPVLVDDGWENANAGILGADNKSAVAMILEVARRCTRRGLAGRPRAALHRRRGGRPARRQALRHLASCERSSATCSTTRPPIGELVTASPTLYRVEAEFHGKSAHAGLRPEDGRSAILAAAHAAIAMPHGRIDDQTTANLGYLHGGVESTNVVPERARLLAEVRSRRRRQGRRGPRRR